MPDQCKALSNISSALRDQVLALEAALSDPRDHDIPVAMRLLLEAIDHVNSAAEQVDRRVTA